MSKIKTHSGAAKRFKKNGSGKYKHKQSHSAHILTKKTRKRKRHLKGLKIVKDCQNNAIEAMLPNLKR